MEGRIPVREWIEGLDRKTRSRVEERLTRARLGNLGDTKPVGEGVSEMRMDYGPGYRLYYGEDGPIVVILLCGGEKHRQVDDIRTAIGYWNEYRARKARKD